MSTANVVPVWVSTSKKPGVDKLVYALLDTQSDSTFIDERVCKELLTDIDPVKLKLTTMVGKDATVHCRRAEGLKVRRHTSTKYIDLPLTYTRDFIPLDKRHIPTPDTAMNWEHLFPIASAEGRQHQSRKYVELKTGRRRRKRRKRRRRTRRRRRRRRKGLSRK